MIKKIGLLLPRSVIYPSIGFDLANGLRTGLAEADIDSDIIINTESIEVGGDDKLIYTQCEKLLLDGATIVAGYVNPSSAEKLEGLFASANALFIALDAGYHFPTQHHLSPHLFYLSLEGALCCRMAATAATEAGHQNLAFACSFYDAGYRSSFAFYQGLAEKEGNVTFNHVTKLKRSEFTLEPLTTHLSQSDTHAILAAFCGDMLLDFFNAAAAGNLFKEHAVYGSSFIGEEQWLAQSPYPGIDIRVYVPWGSRLTHAANLHFKEAMKKNNQRATIFSLLGWETARMITAIAQTTQTAEAIQLLERLRFESPRGEVSFAAKTHRSYAPVYAAQVKKDDATGNCILVPEQRMAEGVTRQRQQFQEEVEAIEGPMTSWYNAYACLES